MREHPFVVVDLLRHDLQELFQVRKEGGWDVARDAADAHVTDGQAGAAHHLEEIEDALALARGVHQQRHAGAGDVQHVGRKPEQVGRNALQLRHDHAQRLRARRDLNAEQLFHGETIAQVIAHRREIVHAVGVIDEIFIAFVFTCLLKTAVQIAQIGVHIDDGLAV